jgi:hypothetical protein
MVMRHEALFEAAEIDVVAVEEMYADVLRLFSHKKPVTSLPLYRYQLLGIVRLVYIVHGQTKEPVDLDALVDPEPKHVRLKKGGPVHKVPSDIPVDLWLRVNRYSVGGHTNLEVIKGLHDAILELLQLANPTLAKLDMNLSEVVDALPRIYFTSAADAAPPPKPRPRPKATQARTGKTKRGAPTSTRPRASSSPT